MEIRVPAAPVGDLGERMSGEDVLQGGQHAVKDRFIVHGFGDVKNRKKRSSTAVGLSELRANLIRSKCAHLRFGINQADSMFVDRYQEGFWVIWIGCLLATQTNKKVGERM